LNQVLSWVKNHIKKSARSVWKHVNSVLANNLLCLKRQSKPTKLLYTEQIQDCAVNVLYLIISGCRFGTAEGVLILNALPSPLEIYLWLNKKGSHQQVSWTCLHGFLLMLYLLHDHKVCLFVHFVVNSYQLSKSITCNHRY
jgi:hypothetical protein